MAHSVSTNFTKRDELTPDVNGFVQIKYVSAYIEEYVRNSGLNRYVPVDGAPYKIYNGYPEEWARFFLTQIVSTSNYNALFLKSIYRYVNLERIDDTRVGLFALTTRESGLTLEELKQPKKNINAAIDMYTKRILKDGKIFPSDVEFDSVITGAGLQTETGAYIVTEDGDYIIQQ
jgi:hypothetical protein